METQFAEGREPQPFFSFENVVNVQDVAFLAYHQQMALQSCAPSFLTVVPVGLVLVGDWIRVPGAGDEEPA